MYLTSTISFLSLSPGNLINSNLSDEVSFEANNKSPKFQNCISTTSNPIGIGIGIGSPINRRGLQSNLNNFIDSNPIQINNINNDDVNVNSFKRANGLFGSASGFQSSFYHKRHHHYQNSNNNINDTSSPITRQSKLSFANTMTAPVNINGNSNVNKDDSMVWTNNNGNMHNNNVTAGEPRSPHLDPVSLAGSPSGYVLNHSTLPSSLSGPKGSYFLLNNVNGGVNNIVAGERNSAIDIPLQPLNSPHLQPVQTPMEQPMTPLSLSRTTSQSVERSGGFAERVSLLPNMQNLSLRSSNGNMYVLSPKANGRRSSLANQFQIPGMEVLDEQEGENGGEMEYMNSNIEHEIQQALEDELEIGQLQNTQN